MHHRQRISPQCERSITDKRLDGLIIRTLSNLKDKIDAQTSSSIEAGSS